MSSHHLAWLEHARGPSLGYERSEAQHSDDSDSDHDQQQEEEEKQPPAYQTKQYALKKKPARVEDQEYHTSFLHDLYGVRTSLSESRRRQAAQHAAEYREVVPRPEGRAVNLGVDLPESIVGRTIARRKVNQQHRRQRTAEDVEADWARRGYAQPSYIPPDPYARPHNVPGAPQVKPIRPTSAMTVRTQPNIASAIAAATMTAGSATARPSTATHMRSPSPPSAAKGLGVSVPQAQAGAWTTRARPSSSRATMPPNALHSAPSGGAFAWNDATAAAGHLHSGSLDASPSHSPNPSFFAHTPSDAHPGYTPGEKIYVLRQGASKYAIHSPTPPPAPSSQPAAVGANAFVPMRQLFVGQQRPASAGPAGPKPNLTVDVGSPRPMLTGGAGGQVQSTSTALVLHNPASAGAKLVVHAKESLDFTDPYIHQAHAILCSLLPASAVPGHYPYISHLPIELVLASPSGPTGDRDKVAQVGPPVSRLIDLHLALEHMQNLSAQFDGLPCVILGRKMEAEAKCGVRVDAIQVGTGTPFPEQTQAKTREKLMAFLQQITHQHRQEIWEEITSLPRLVLWFIHYDQAAEIVVRLAEIGVKARVVHMANEASSKQHASDAKSVILPRRTFTWYSLHLSSVTQYSLPILQLLAKILRAKRTPNFIYSLTDEEKEEQAWMSSRAAVLRHTQDKHQLIPYRDPAQATGRSLSTQVAAGWMRPDATVSSALTTTKPLHPSAVGSATGLTPHQLNNLPRRQQKTALRKEILLILNQKAYMQAKKEQLVVDRHKMELVKVALEGEIKHLDMKSEKHHAKMTSEATALAERIRVAKERKEREEALIAAEKEALAARESAAVNREVLLSQTQQEITEHFAAIENEKVGVLQELDLIEEELRQLSQERRAVMNAEERLSSDRAADEEERMRMSKQSEQIHELERIAREEKRRLEEEERRLGEEDRKLREMNAAAEAEHRAIEEEHRRIEEEKKKVEEERKEIQRIYEENQAKLRSEADAIREEDLRLKSALTEEQTVLAKKLSELRSVENHIYLSKNLDVETEKLESERREIAEANKKLQEERKKMEEELEAETQRRRADLDAKEQELNALEEQRLRDWEKKLADEKAQREFEEKERIEKAAAERAERYKMKRESKMAGKPLSISTDLASLKSRGSVSSGGLQGVDENGQLIPVPTTPVAGPITGLGSVTQKNGNATFEAVLSVKKLVMTAEDIAALTPAEKRKFEKEQASHAEYDDMYRQYLGISYKQIRKSGPPAIYMLLHLSVEKVDKVSVMLGAMPVIEVHNLRGKTSSLVEETEAGSKDTQNFLPLLLDVAKICALQLERPILFKIMQFNRQPDEPREYIGETQMNLVELQSHSVVPIINLNKQKKEGKNYTDAGKLHIHQAELYVQSTYGLTHHPSPNLKDPANPTFTQLTKCLIRFEAKGVNLTMGGGFFGASKDVAPFLEFYRKEAESGKWGAAPFYKSEFRVGSNVTFTAVRFGFFDASYADLNRPILCQLKHDSNLGKDDVINEFEFTLGEMLGTDVREYPAGAADKKGVRSGKLVFSHTNSYSALTDLGALCDAAGLQPQPVVKSKENADLPPLGLDSMMVENQGRIATANANPQPIAFGHWVEPVSQPPTPVAATPTKPIVVTRKSVVSPDTQSISGRKASVASPSDPRSGLGSTKSPGHNKAGSTTGPEKGTLSSKKKRTNNQ